jgi:hypothetical protein
LTHDSEKEDFTRKKKRKKTKKSKTLFKFSQLFLFAGVTWGLGRQGLVQSSGFRALIPRGITLSAIEMMNTPQATTDNEWPLRPLSSDGGLVTILRAAIVVRLAALRTHDVGEKQQVAILSLLLCLCCVLFTNLFKGL